MLNEWDGRIALNRPEVMNVIDDDLPQDLASAVERADSNPNVHAMVLSSAGQAFRAAVTTTIAPRVPERFR